MPLSGGRTGSTAGLSSVGNSVAKSFRKVRARTSPDYASKRDDDLWFPSRVQRRAAALSVVLSGFGLSAFFCRSSRLVDPQLVHAPYTAHKLIYLDVLAWPTDSTIASIFLHPTSSRPHPHHQSPSPDLVSSRSDPTSAFLLLLAIGSLVSMLVGLIFVRPVPLPASRCSPVLETVKTTLSAGVAQGGTVSSEGGEAVATERDPLLPPSSSRRVTSEETPIPGTTTTATPTTERNITGWALFRELDFYLIFLFNGLCAGVGLCCPSAPFPLLLPLAVSLAWTVFTNSTYTAYRHQ